MTNFEKFKETISIDEAAADVMLQDLNRSAADCAELFIKLAAETQRAVEG